MKRSADEAATPRDDASEPSDLQDLKERLAFIGSRGWQESKATALVVWVQLQRTWSFLSGWWRLRSVEQKYLAAQVALGEQLDAASLGDASLRARLTDLRERRQSFVAAKESTRALDTEIRGLCVRLAEPFLEAVQAPAVVEQPHRRALGLRMEIADRRAQQGERRTSLVPEDSATQTRTAIGIGVLVLLVGLLFSAFSGSESVNELLLPPSIDLESLQPLASFPAATPADEAVTTVGDKQVEDREFELPADAILPARRVKVTFVNGRPEGEVRSVDVQGRVISVETYRNGLLNGTRQRFYPGGEKFSELRFVDGVAQGKDTIWFPDGMLAARTDIVDGSPHGESTIYFENGRKCVSTTYVQGQPHGQRSHYRPDEVCFAIVDWREGEPVAQKFLEIETTADDVAAIEKRGEFSTRLVDYWSE
ncbi:MAG: hypothetical protein JNG89_19485 [Planctomycetaceae bacterium]|nr:hypothetical protein [Planctomycetaceae bacterium]